MVWKNLIFLQFLNLWTFLNTSSVQNVAITWKQNLQNLNSPPVELKFFFPESFRSFTVTGEILPRQLFPAWGIWLQSLYMKIQPVIQTLFILLSVFSPHLKASCKVMYKLLFHWALQLPAKCHLVFGRPYPKMLHMSLWGPVLWKEYYNYSKNRKSWDHVIYFPVEFKSEIHRDHLKTIYLEYPNAMPWSVPQYTLWSVKGDKMFQSALNSSCV